MCFINSVCFSVKKMFPCGFYPNAHVLSSAAFVFLPQLPFWNGCDEDDHCVPDLVIQSQTDLISRKYEHILPLHYRRHTEHTGSDQFLRLLALCSALGSSVDRCSE